MYPTTGHQICKGKNERLVRRNKKFTVKVGNFNIIPIVIDRSSN